MADPTSQPRELAAAARITVDQVRQVARLSRLAIDESQAPQLASELENILKYVAQINEIDSAAISGRVTETEPHDRVANVLRPDAVEPALPIDQVLLNAPQADGTYFMVPKVVGGDEDSAG